MAFKYIVGYQHPYVTATIFGENIAHVEIMRRVYKDKKHVISAGFGIINATGDVSVYGNSVGLDLHSRPEDKVHVEIALGMRMIGQDPIEHADFKMFRKRIHGES